MVTEPKAYYVLARKPTPVSTEKPKTEEPYQFVFYQLNQKEWQMHDQAYCVDKVSMPEAQAREAQQYMQKKGFEVIVARHDAFNHTDGIDLDQMLFEDELAKKMHREE